MSERWKDKVPNKGDDGVSLTPEHIEQKFQKLLTDSAARDAARKADVPEARMADAISFVVTFLLSAGLEPEDPQTKLLVKYNLTATDMESLLGYDLGRIDAALGRGDIPVSRPDTAFKEFVQEYGNRVLDTVSSQQPFIRSSADEELADDHVTLGPIEAGAKSQLSALFQKKGSADSADLAGRLIADIKQYLKDGVAEIIKGRQGPPSSGSVEMI